MSSETKPAEPEAAEVYIAEPDGLHEPPPRAGRWGDPEFNAPLVTLGPGCYRTPARRPRY